MTSAPDDVAALAAELTKLAQDTLDYPVSGPEGLAPLFAAARTALQHDVSWVRPYLAPSYFPVADQDDFAAKCRRFLREAAVQQHMAADPDKMH